MLLWHTGGSAKAPSSHGAKRHKTQVSGQGPQREQKQRRLDKARQSSGKTHYQLHGCRADASASPPTAGRELTGTPDVPSRSGQPIMAQAHREPQEPTAVHLSDCSRKKDPHVRQLPAAIPSRPPLGTDLPTFPVSGHQHSFLSPLGPCQSGPVRSMCPLQQQRAGSALLDHATDALGLSEPAQQEQSPGAVACMHNVQHHASRADDLQHASGTELSHALHLELSHAAQPEAHGNGVHVPHAGDRLALHAPECHHPDGEDGGPDACNDPAGILQTQGCQAGGSCTEHMAAQDFSDQAVLRTCPGSPGMTGGQPAAGEGLAACRVMSAAEGALENEVDRRMSEAGSGSKAKKGDGSDVMMLMKCKGCLLISNVHAWGQGMKAN